MKTDQQTDYQVQLEIFEGPMDLLLHLIRKNEVDIFDIPIAVITDQYLAYIDIMKALNINVAGDFLVMASTLIHIKSKMLLPGLDEEEADDLRAELTGPILEYLRLKEIAGELSEMDILDRDVFARRLSPQDKAQFQGEENLLDVNLFQLMDAFKKILDQNLPGISLKMEVEKWSLKEKTTFIMDRLKEVGVMYFENLFEGHRTISEFVVTFLAILELVHIGLLKVFQPDPNKDIRLEANFTDTVE